MKHLAHHKFSTNGGPYCIIISIVHFFCSLLLMLLHCEILNTDSPHNHVRPYIVLY